MENNRIFILLALTALLLIGCGNKAAIDEAKAYQIQLEADQYALNQEQIRIANDAAARQKAVDDAYWNEVRASALVATKTAATLVAYSLGIALCVVILGGGWSAKETVIGLGNARVARAYLEAQLIHMDENTRTFPAFKITTVGGGHFITMLATGQTLKLNKEQAANPLLIAALAQVSATGVYAREASKVGVVRGNDVQIFNPTVIDGASGDDYQ